MSLNVILPNLSLAFSSVTFYQVARILLTPCVALMNFVLYQATLPRAALAALVPACAGVGMVSYYDSLPAADATVKTTSGLGVMFAFTGIFASSLYTVWIGAYHRKLQMSSMQLLFNQAPVSAFMLLYVIPFVDTFPVWSEVPLNRWVMILIVSLPVQALPCSQQKHGLRTPCLHFPSLGGGFVYPSIFGHGVQDMTGRLREDIFSVPKNKGSRNLHRTAPLLEIGGLRFRFTRLGDLVSDSLTRSSFFAMKQSGGFAALINISQFFIIAQTGPVSSTVVGHVKTCTIVALGWMSSGRAIGDKSVLGVFVAIGGIIAYV